MKKILLLSVCLASCLALSASAFSDAGPPQTKKEIVVVEPGVAQFHSFEINAVPEFNLVMFEQPVAVVLPNTSEKIKETKVDALVYPDTDVGWRVSGPKISDNSICRIRLLSC